MEASCAQHQKRSVGTDSLHVPWAVYNNGKFVEKDTFSFSSWLATANQVDVAQALQVQWLHLCLVLDVIMCSMRGCSVFFNALASKSLPACVGRILL